MLDIKLPPDVSSYILPKFILKFEQLLMKGKLNYWVNMSLKEDQEAKTQINAICCCFLTPRQAYILKNHTFHNALREQVFCSYVSNSSVK